MDYNKSVSLVIQSASRAFGYNQMQVTRRSAIYNIYWCGQFVSYSAPNWGFKEFASVNKLHNQAYRYFLGWVIIPPSQWYTQTWAGEPPIRTSG